MKPTTISIDGAIHVGGLCNLEASQIREYEHQLPVSVYDFRQTRLVVAVDVPPETTESIAIAIDGPRRHQVGPRQAA